MQMSRLTRIVTTAVATLALAPAATAAAPATTRTSCPPKANLGKVRAAVLCLHNQERAAHGLRQLKDNKKLRRRRAGTPRSWSARAASSTATSPAASGARRLPTAGPTARTSPGAPAASRPPGEIHRAWMNSPGHRANILRPQFREIGIGIALGAAGAGSDGATYTADFGARR